MIDGIKLDCLYLDPADWKGNERLQFVASVDLRTGEILPVPETATLDGLTFKITPSKTDPGGYYHSIEGSLHRFANGGGSNAEDFPFASLAAVVAHLVECFQIIPEKTRVKNLEFGVNITLPDLAEKFLKGVISMPDKKFVRLDVDRPKLGWICKRSEYGFKLYDKGKQSGKPVDNLLRVELTVKKMRYLSRYQISTLADLVNPAKVGPLIDLITNQFSEMIFYDGVIDPKTLTPRDRHRLERFTNPRRWVEMSRQARYKFRQSMDRFLIQHGATDTKTNALLSIQKKWQELLNMQRFGGDDFTGVKDQRAALQRVTISPLECQVKPSPFKGEKTSKNKFAGSPPETPLQEGANTPQNERTFCQECGRDISHQNKGSRFCSEKLYGKQGKRCRNRYHGRRRTTRKRAAREREAEALTVWLLEFHGQPVRLVVYCGLHDVPQILAADWSEFITWDHRSRSQVTRIDAPRWSGDGIEVFTGMRAKRLIIILKSVDYERSIGK